MGKLVILPCVSKERAAALKKSAHEWQHHNRKQYNDYRREIARMIRRDDLVGSALVVLDKEGNVETITDLDDSVAAKALVSSAAGISAKGDD